MVLKKKGSTEQEVQEGWAGHVLPFELVQKTLLTEKVNTISDMEDRLSEIGGQYGELLDSLSEEDKEQDFVNEDSFVAAEVKKAIKAAALDAGTLAVLKKVDWLFAEEKALKKQIKTASAELHILCSILLQRCFCLMIF